MKNFSKRNKIGIGFFISSAIIFLIFLFMIFFVDHGYDIGSVIQGAIDFIVLIISLALCVIGIALCWNIKQLRLVIYIISGISLFMFLAPSLYFFIFTKADIKKYHQNQKITQNLVVIYNDKIQHVNDSDLKIISLLNQFKSELKKKKVNTKIKDDLTPLEYKKFMHDIYFYLGLFFDKKYLNNEFFGDATFWYDESYEKYKALFTTEEHYIKYFQLLYKHTYSDVDQKSIGLHENDQEKYAKTVLDKGYINAYLALAPLLDAAYATEKNRFKRQLNYAMSLDFKINKQIATKAFLTKTNHYTYTYSKDVCSLSKTITSYTVLKNTTFLHEYMDLVINQIPTQCSHIRRWDYVSNDKEFKDAICYIKKTPKWFKIIQQDLMSIKGYILTDEYCLK